jgi:DNA repair exonuclease SbcCD ATPase subunit
MSLKLDELRKRLLLQQSGSSEGGVPEPSPSVGNDKTSNIATPKAVEPATVSEQPAVAFGVAKAPVTAVVPELSVENEMQAAEPSVVMAAARPSEASVAETAGTISSRNESEPEEPRSRSGVAVDVSPRLAAPYELADAVGKVFEQTKALQARLEDLGRIFEPIDRMGNSAVRAFAPLRGFQKQMAQLARSFEPMRTFQQQLSQLAQDFEPMKALEGQLSQLARSFQTHIGDLIRALEPAKQIRDRIEQLGAAFDQATELQEQFTELYDAFQLSPSNGHANGLAVHDGAAS